MMDATPEAARPQDDPAPAVLTALGPSQPLEEAPGLAQTLASAPAAPVVPLDRHGTFLLTAPVSEDLGIATDIEFRIAPGTIAVPADQEALKTAVDSTLTSLRIILRPDTGEPATKRRFSEYFNRIVSAARVGLQTPAYTEVAMPELQAVRAEIVYREGPTIGNRYLKRLGARALLYFLLAMTIQIGSVLLERHGPAIFAHLTLHNLPLMWAGSMMGAWLSIGISRRAPSLEDLARIREDSLDADIRLVFVGLLTVVVGLVLLTNMVTITVGDFDGSTINKQWMVALLVGAFCGIGEKAMSNRLVQQAERLFGGGAAPSPSPSPAPQPAAANPSPQPAPQGAPAPGGGH